MIVTSGDPIVTWITSSGLGALSAEEQALDADPDNDGIANLLEYALAGDPVKMDRNDILPTFDDSSGRIVITFIRIKASVDDTITYKGQLTTNLGDAALWNE